MKKLPLFCLLLCICLGCSSPLVKKSSQRPLVLVTVPPFKTFVEKIVDHELEVVSLVPPGANPHTYEVTPKQATHLEKAAVWIRNGDTLENQPLKLLGELNPTLTTINLTTALKLKTPRTTYLGCKGGGHSHDHPDTHIWMSPRLAQDEVEKITEVLSDRFPELRETFRENSKRLISELKELDQTLTKQLAPFKGEALLTAHPALGYFCETYQMKQLSLECEGKQLGAKDLIKLLDKLNQWTVRCIFTFPEFNPKGARLVAEEKNLPIYEIDVLDDDYFDMMYHLGDLIAESKER